VDSDCPSVVVLGAPHFLSTDGIVGSVSTRDNDIVLFKEYFKFLSRLYDITRLYKYKKFKIFLVI